MDRETHIANNTRRSQASLSIVPCDIAKKHGVRPRGFTLLEVIISLAILGVSMGSLMDAQMSSINVVGRARDITIATMLAKSKLIDIEEYLLDEGFQQGTETEKGNFKDEGWPEFQWNYEILEVEMDFMNLTDGLGSMFMGGISPEEENDGVGGFGDALTMAGPLLEPFLENLGHSLRLVKLRIHWPAGQYTRKVDFSILVTKRDFTFVPQGLDQQDN